MFSHLRRTTTAVAAGMLTALVATAAVADDHTSDSEVTQSVNPGSRTATLAALGLDAIDYSHTDKTSAGNVGLTVDDSSATGEGWNVNVVSSDFVYSGDNNGTDIPAANFALTSAGDPVHVEGQDIDETNGPRALQDNTGALDEARAVIEADADHGQGIYTQDLGVALTVPGQSRAGTYTGTVTTTITAGPTA